MYHITEDGQVKECKRLAKCNLAHFETEDEAYSSAQKLLSSTYGLFAPNEVSVSVLNEPGKEREIVSIADISEAIDKGDYTVLIMDDDTMLVTDEPYEKFLEYGL